MGKEKVKRIILLDEIRGFSVACMIVYHAFFLLSDVFKLEPGKLLLQFFMPAQPFISSIFILVAGISSRLSRSNARRGFKLLLIALGFSLVTTFFLPLMGLEGLGIYFGILHFLSVSMLFFAASQKLLDKIPPLWGLLACSLLYFFTANIGKGFLGFSASSAINLPQKLYESNYLFPLGIYGPGFYSSDYFPVFPRIFMFLAGTYFGRALKNIDLPAWVYERHVKFFEFLGRHSLLIYVAHVPIIYVLVYLFQAISKFLF